MSNNPPKKQPAKKESSSLTKKDARPGADDVRRAIAVLSEALLTAEGEDPGVGSDDIWLGFSLSLRVGDEDVMRVSGERMMPAALASPGVVSATEEFETTVRQILLPCNKAVHRAVIERMKKLPGHEESLGFTRTPGMM